MQRIGRWCLLLLVVAVVDVSASSVVRMSLSEMVNAADLVVDGIVVGTETRRIGSDINTVCILKVQRTIKGAATTRDKVHVIFRSGRQGDLGVQVMGEPNCPAPGTEVVLLGYGDAKSARVVGFSQGWFEVERGRIRIQDHELKNSYGKTAAPNDMVLQNGVKVAEFLDRLQFLAAGNKPKAKRK